MSKFSLDRTNLASTVAQLQAGLGSLTLDDNFQGFTQEVEIAAGEEVLIRNKIRDRIPSGYWVISIAGQNTLTRGETEWTEANLYLKNRATTSTVKALVFFYK